MAGQPPGYNQGQPQQPQQPGGYPQQQPQQPGGYPPQGQQPYGAPQPGYSQLKPHRGGMLIAFAAVSWFVCIIFGIVAFVMAKTDLAEMQAGVMDKSGEGLTKAAYYLSIAQFAFVGLMIILYIVLFAAMGASGQF